MVAKLVTILGNRQELVSYGLIGFAFNLPAFLYLFLRWRPIVRMHKDFPLLTERIEAECSEHKDKNFIQGASNVRHACVSSRAR